MNRWKLMVFNHWQAKLLSFAVATLMWLAIRQALAPGSGAPAPFAQPTPTGLP